MNYKGSKRVTNFMKNQEELAEWLATAPDDEVEAYKVQREMEKDLLETTWVKVEKVIAVTEDDDGEAVYLCLWKGLQHDQATWERPEDIQDFQDEIDDFLKRIQQYLDVPKGR